jgi:membrane glycosyltransferase
MMRDEFTPIGLATYLDRVAHTRLVTTPALARVSMVPRPWPDARAAERGAGAAPGGDARKKWYHVANRRRFVLVGLALGQTWLATMLMSGVLPYHGQQPLEFVILVLFAILFTWVSMGFWTALAGFFVLMRRGDPYAISRSAKADATIADAARTAIVMPICRRSTRGCSSRRCAFRYACESLFT